MRPKKKRRGRRALVTAPATLARREGHRIVVLRGSTHRARLEELAARMRSEVSTSKNQEFMEEALRLAQEPGPYTFIGFMSTNPKVVFDPNTLQPIEGAEIIPGDVLWPENEFLEMLRSGEAQVMEPA